MAVTTSSYTVNPTYTASQFADAFRDALIASGHMAAWYDSFANGALQHRVLEITYDGSKTYGKTYYWFIFSGADMFMHVTTGWNLASDIPAGVGGAGVQYEDWLTNATNTTGSHMRFAALNAGQTITIKRYTSGTFTVFLFVNGTTNYTLIIDRTAPLSAFVDLNREIYVGAFWARTRTFPSTGINVALANFQSYPIRLRRSYLGRMLRGVTSTSEYGAGASASAPWELWQVSGLLINHLYGAPGNENAITNYSAEGRSYILLPVGFTNVNPSFTTDEKPAIDGLILNPYSSLALPAGEFIVYPVYSNNTLQVGATIVISAGVEEYEIISCANSTVINDRPSIAICARII